MQRSDQPIAIGKVPNQKLRVSDSEAVVLDQMPIKDLVITESPLLSELEEPSVESGRGYGRIESKETMSSEGLEPLEDVSFVGLRNRPGALREVLAADQPAKRVAVQGAGKVLNDQEVFALVRPSVRGRLDRESEFDEKISGKRFPFFAILWNL
jgi:hypothetical protein